MRGLWSSVETFTEDSDHPPKYPTNWGYTAYSESVSNTFNPPFRVLTPAMMQTLSAGGSVTPGSFTGDGVFTRRSTDVLISRDDVADEYFALPNIAVGCNDTENCPDGNHELHGNRKTIQVFNGTNYLEAFEGIELKAQVNGALTVGSLTLYWTKNKDANFRNPKTAPLRGSSAGGLWLPGLGGSHPLYYYVPFLPGVHAEGGAFSAPYYDYTIGAPGDIDNGDKIEFVFRLDNGDMFVARLDAKGIPSDWYRRVRPFSFDILNIKTHQRGNVTVMNNVINSEKRELAYLFYSLPRAGRVTIQVYTLDGSLVKSIRRNEYRDKSEYTDTWDGTNNGGRPVARGMYFIRVVGPDIDEIRKVMVVK